MNALNETLVTSETRTAPPGLTLRPYAGVADIPVIVDIINRELEADGVPFREDAGHVGAWYSNPSENFDATRDVTIAEIDGVPVAQADRSWVDTTLEPVYREYRMGGAVVPEWRNMGIGTALIRHNQQKLRELAQGPRHQPAASFRQLELRPPGRSHQGAGGERLREGAPFLRDDA